jgi:tripartite-type tricarboxylate transporter receptor subunit TctC
MGMMPLKGCTSLLLTAVILSVLAPREASCQSDAEFFKGKTVNLMIGYPPGAGNDVYGRLVARHLGRHIPGNPTIVPQNMPGVGSFKAANYMYNAAPKDGTVLGYIAQTAATEQLLGSPAVQFKAEDFGWIGRISSYVLVTVSWRTSKVATIEQAKTVESTMGVTGVGSTVYIYPNVLNNLIGTKFKLVSGYAGTAESMLAMERGEVDGTSTGWFTMKLTKQDWVAEKKANILVQYVAERHPDLPDVPTVLELGRTAEERQLLQILANEGEVGKTIITPPGLPAGRLATLRAAFDAMVKDPEVLAEVKKAGLDFDPATGERVEAMIRGVASTPPEIVQRARAMMRK